MYSVLGSWRVTQYYCTLLDFCLRILSIHYPTFALTPQSWNSAMGFPHTYKKQVISNINNGGGFKLLQLFCTG